MAMGFVTLLFLDSVFRVMPKMPLTIEAAKRENYNSEKAARNPNNLAAQGGKLWGSWDWFCLVPLASLDILSHAEFARFIMYWTFILAPVPFTRAILEDHTAGQVMAGTFIGISEALLWFAMVRHVQSLNNHKLGQTRWRIQHNYALPRFEVRAKCVRMLAKIEGATEGTEPLSSELLRNMSIEIDWYARMTQKQMLQEDSTDEYEFLDLEMLNFRPLQQKLRKVINDRGSMCDMGYLSTFDGSPSLAAGPSTFQSTAAASTRGSVGGTEMVS